MDGITKEDLGFDVARARAEAELLRYENERLRTELNRVSVERDQLQVQTEAMRANDYRTLYVVSCEELEECECAREELRSLVCARSDECIDFRSLVDTANEHYNPDD